MTLISQTTLKANNIKKKNKLKNMALGFIINESWIVIDPGKYRQKEGKIYWKMN